MLQILICYIKEKIVETVPMSKFYKIDKYVRDGLKIFTSMMIKKISNLEEKN